MSPFSGPLWSFVLCHINCMEILTTIIYLFHIKTWNFLYKNPRVFLLHFFIATNIANKPLSDCITSPKTILLFHFSPKPTAEGHLSIPIPNPTSLNSSPRANCQICLLFTERYQSQKPESV